MGNHKLNIKDFLWYFIGNICPIIIGVIKFPIFTRVYSPADFGAYSLVMLSFTYVSVVCYSWINSCAWRYYFEYKRQGRINSLFANLSFLFLLFTAAVLLFSLLYVYNTDNLLIKKLVLYCFLQYVSSELLSLYLVVPRLEGKSFYYNCIQIIRAIGSFGLLLFLAFYNKMGIEAFIISSVIFNLALLLIVLPRDVFKLKLSPGLVNKKDASLLFAYGKMGLFINLCGALLISSDRFLIERYTNLKDVGIYNQNYNIAQITISTLASVYWSSLSPFILRVLEGRKALVTKMVQAFFDAYFLLALPICIYSILYAKQIAEIMLGADFRAGHSIIGWVALSEFFIGLYYIPALKLKLDNKLKTLSLYYLAALLINIGLNIIFIRQFGYKSSALVSAIVYLLLLSCIYRHDAFNCFPQLVRSQKFRWCVAFIFLQVAIHFISARFELPLYYYVIEATVFAATYAFFAVKNRWISLAGN